MKKILSELKEFRWWIVVALLGVGLAALAEVTLPSMFARIVNIITGSSLDTEGKMALAIQSIGSSMLLVVIATIISAVVGNFCVSKVAAELSRKLRFKVFSKVQTFTEKEMREFSTGSLITRSTNDINQVQQFVTMFMRIFVRFPIIMVGSILRTYDSNPRLARPLLFTVPIIIVIVFFVFRFVVPQFSKLQAGIDKINLTLREQISGVRVIRAFTNDEREDGRFHTVNKEYSDTSRKTYKLMAIMSPLLTIVLNATVVFVLILATNDINNGVPIISGDILAVTQYVTQILFAFIMVSMIFATYPRAEVSAKRIFEVLDKRPSIVDLNNPKKLDGSEESSIEFRNVSFSFPDAGKPALEGISFKFKKGTTNAIIGSTGSGKTILLKLLLRFYDVTQGIVLINGIDIREIRQEDLRGRIGYVPQTTDLFAGTIAENLRYGKEDATKEEMEKAAATAQALDFIEAKGGFDSEVAKKGGNFSGGQKQRLSIARALIRKPDFYIWDDSFSALDATTDKRLRDALKRETAEAIQIVVAQRVSSIADSDHIIVLDNGRIIGEGKHHQLLETCSVYREIAESQFSEEEAV